MPLLKGEALDRRLQWDGTLSLAEILRIGREIAHGLSAAHAAGLIHRDIKPANIWLETRDQGPGVRGQEGSSSLAPDPWPLIPTRVRILDFGLARAAAQEAGLTQQGAVIGTPAYMAPEQARGATVDARCDLWSLGVVLYRLCTGKLPFQGADAVSTMMQVATANPAAPARMNPAIPAELSKLVMHLLEKDPARRPVSAAAVVQVLRDLEQSNTLPPMGAAPPAPKKRSPLLLLLGGLGPAVLLAGVILFWQTPHGLVRLESDDPMVTIVFDQNGPTITGADKEPLSLRAGDHGIVIKRGDFTFVTDKLLLKKGETITLKVELVQGKLQATAGERVLGASTLNYTNRLGMEFALVPKGKAWLGGGGGKPGEEGVSIPDDFYLGVYEVTHEEWEKVMGLKPSCYFSREGEGKEALVEIADDVLKRFPVENVSWDECQLFLTKLNERDPQASWVYRLPTEAEWEYACRGGPHDKFHSAFDFYLHQPINVLLPTQANIEHEKGLRRPRAVGAFMPNRLGLHDMHGNVAELTHNNQATKDDAGNPHHNERGGGWTNQGEECTATGRFPRSASERANDVGLRVARVPSRPSTPAAAPPPSPVKSDETLPPTFTNRLGMEFVLVGKGTALLGGGEGRPGDKKVEIAHDFYLGKYEVTQEEWHKVTGLNPSYFSREGGGKDEVAAISDAELKRFPVEMVSWHDAQLFLEELNQRTKETGWVYRLPKEVEWEYACRDGPLANKFDSAFDYYFDRPMLHLKPGQANFEHKKCLKRACKVGSYAPNRLGLYDMHGNVWEWCEDAERQDDGKVQRRNRGGGWGHVPECCSAEYGESDPPTARFETMGLRVARVPASK
jgi:formylglycine-generating enzyme required for sulfatase activity